MSHVSSRFEMLVCIPSTRFFSHDTNQIRSLSTFSCTSSSGAQGVFFWPVAGGGLRGVGAGGAEGAGGAGGPQSEGGAEGSQLSHAAEA